MIGPDEFRRALGHFATGVTVVTTREIDGSFVGLTASAVASVSLDPPLVLVCVDQKAQCYQALLEGEAFAISVLGADHEDLSRRFATRGLEKFEGVPYTVGRLGLPLLDGALAHVECTTLHRYPGGDHTIFVGRVEHATVTGGNPLLYFQGRYRRLSGDHR